LGRGHDRVADPLIATASPDETTQFRFSLPRNRGTSVGAAGDKLCVDRTTRLWQPSRQRQIDVDKRRRTHVLAVGSGALLHDTLHQAMSRLVELNRVLDRLIPLRRSMRNQPIKYTVELIVVHSSQVIDVGWPGVWLAGCKRRQQGPELIGV